MLAMVSCQSGFPKMPRSSKDSKDAFHPEEFPLNSLESRVAARALLQNKSTVSARGLAEILGETRRKRLEGSEPMPTAEDYIEKAERLAKTASPDNQVAQRMIAAYKRIARHREQGAETKLSTGRIES